MLIYFKCIPIIKVSIFIGEDSTLRQDLIQMLNLSYNLLGSPCWPQIENPQISVSQVLGFQVYITGQALFFLLNNYSQKTGTKWMKYLGLKFSPKDLGAKVFFSNLVLLCGREEKYVKSLGHWRHFTRGNCVVWPCFSTLLLVSHKKSSFA